MNETLPALVHKASFNCCFYIQNVENHGLYLRYHGHRDPSVPQIDLPTQHFGQTSQRAPLPDDLKRSKAKPWAARTQAWLLVT